MLNCTTLNVCSGSRALFLRYHHRSIRMSFVSRAVASIWILCFSLSVRDRPNNLPLEILGYFLYNSNPEVSIASMWHCEHWVWYWLILQFARTLLSLTLTGRFIDRRCSHATVAVLETVFSREWFSGITLVDVSWFFWGLDLETTRVCCRYGSCDCIFVLLYDTANLLLNWFFPRSLSSWWWTFKHRIFVRRCKTLNYNVDIWLFGRQSWIAPIWFFIVW